MHSISSIAKSFSTIIFFTMVFFTISPLCSQTTDAEVLLKNYREKSDFYYVSKPDSSLFYMDESIKIIKGELLIVKDEEVRDSLRSLLGEAAYYSAVLEFRLGRYDNAMQRNLVSVKNYLYCKNKQGLSLTLSTVGVVHMSRGEYPKALKYYHHALKLKEDLKDTAGIAYVLNNIGVTFRDLGDYESAKGYYDRALQMYEKLEDSLGMAVCLNNIGSYYSHNDQLDRAKFYYNRALEIRRIKGERKSTASTLNNLGVVYRKQGKLHTSLEYFEEAYAIVNEYKDLKGIGHSLLNIAEVYADLGEVNKAFENALSAFDVGTKSENPEVRRRSAQLLSDLYKIKGHHKESLEMIEIVMDLQNDLNSDDLRKATLKEEVRFEFDKKSALEKILQQNKERTVQNESNWQKTLSFMFAIAFILAILVIAVILNRLSIVKKKNLIIEQKNRERELLLKEIHHRVKNNFQIISSLLRLQSNTQDNEVVKMAFNEAVQRIQSLSIVHEMIYRQDDFSEIKTTEYFEKLFENLDALGLKRKAKLVFEDEVLILDNEILFPLGIVVNELVTNSYKHGFTEAVESPEIFLSIKKSENELILLYSDNGIGFDLMRNNDTFGLELIQTIIEQFDGELTTSKDHDNRVLVKIRLKI